MIIWSYTNMFEKGCSWLKKGIIIFLFVMFLIYFGIPSWNSYKEKKTIFIESTRNYTQTDFPALSIGQFSKNMSHIVQTCYSFNDTKRESLNIILNNLINLFEQNCWLLWPKPGYYCERYLGKLLLWTKFFFEK